MASVRVASSASVESTDSVQSAQFESRGSRSGRKLGVLAIATLALAAVTPSLGFSQAPDFANGQRPPRPAIVREAMLTRFDANNDGQLNEVERATARAWRAESAESMPRPGFRPGAPGNRPDGFRPRPDSIGNSPAGRPEFRGRGRPEGAPTTAALKRLATEVASNLDEALDSYVAQIENEAWVQDVPAPVILASYVNVPVIAAEDFNSFAAVSENAAQDQAPSSTIVSALNIADMDDADLDTLLRDLEDEIWDRELASYMPVIEVLPIAFNFEF